MKVFVFEIVLLDYVRQVLFICYYVFLCVETGLCVSYSFCIFIASVFGVLVYMLSGSKYAT